MKKITALCTTLLLAGAIGCGDNSSTSDDTIIIIPVAGETITALESAELAGFEEPEVDEEAGYIIAFGSMSLADAAMELPGIAEVLTPEQIGEWDHVQWNGQLALDDLAPAHDTWDDRVEWDGNLARIPEPTQPRDPMWNMRAPWHGESKAKP